MTAEMDRDLALAPTDAAESAQESAPHGRHLDDADPRNFSIILGGPLFQLLRRAHMTGDALELVKRRVLVIAAIGWVPLLLLALARGDAIGGPATVPFLKDFEVHVRFLVAMPLLIVAELVVHLRLRPVAYEFLARGLIPSGSIDRFNEALRSAMRLRNSLVAELLMVVLVYSLGVPVVWRALSSLDAPTWFAQGNEFTWAGYWYAYVSIPMFQFLLLRWYFRLVVWGRFLWQVSRLKLHISAMHPDCMGGLAFLSGTVFAFVPLAMAHGAVVSGTIATRVLHLGGALMDAKVEIAVVVAFLLIIVLIPLTFFATQVSAAKRLGSRTYGRLGQGYVRQFEHKWLTAGGHRDESILGSGDIQSLADFGGSLEILRSTRLVPITRQAITLLVVATLLPIAPLLLTVIPAEELAKHLLKLLM